MMVDKCIEIIKFYWLKKKNFLFYYQYYEIALRKNFKKNIFFLKIKYKHYDILVINS